MQFDETSLAGVWLIEPAPIYDQRGFFARTFCARSFAEHGLEADFVQHSTSYSAKGGTLRGMHFQRAPHAETKIVCCLRGAMWDVVVDLRVGSPTYGKWEGFTLTAETRRRVYIAAGCAHGFQTLKNNVETGYLISNWHEPAAAAGIRYDDPDLAIRWPLPLAAISEKDRSWPRFADLNR